MKFQEAVKETLADIGKTITSLFTLKSMTFASKAILAGIWVFGPMGIAMYLGFAKFFIPTAIFCLFWEIFSLTVLAKMIFK